MKTPKEPIGMVVMNMRGIADQSSPDYFHMIGIWDSWVENKTYYATKLRHKRFDKIDQVLGTTRRDIIDTWLTLGYATEKKFFNQMCALQCTAKH